jgi:hypothetical protein
MVTTEGILSGSDALPLFSIRTLVASKMTGTNREIISQIVSERRLKFLTTDLSYDA